MTLFQSSVSRARSVLESFIKGYSGMIVCDGYSAMISWKALPSQIVGRIIREELLYVLT